MFASGRIYLQESRAHNQSALKLSDFDQNGKCEAGLPRLGLKILRFMLLNELNGKKSR